MKGQNGKVIVEFFDLHRSVCDTVHPIADSRVETLAPSFTRDLGRSLEVTTTTSVIPT